MRIYKVSLAGDFGDSHSAALWTSRKSDIPRLQRELSSRCFGEANPEPMVEEVVFSPTRKGIVDMLNRYADQ